MNHVINLEEMVALPKGRVKKTGWKKFLISHARRLGLEVVNLLFNHDWLFYLIGMLNKRVGLIESVFLVYPASEKYALAYVYPHRLPKVLWSPWPCGLLWQNGKFIIMFCIAAHNGQHSDPGNHENLRQMAGRMEDLRRMLNAKMKTFAGILPGILSRGILHTAPEADLTAIIVCQAIEAVKLKEKLPPNTPIIVLGGRGFIGRRVMKLLEGSSTYCIDSSAGQGKADLPGHLRGQQVVVINITLKDSINEYVDEFWPGTVVLNEVYPEPTPDVRKKLRERGCACYHVVGVDAVAFPSFPAAYAGAIPCCAAWPSPKAKAVIRKIN